jgi:hypothetical protein
VDDLVHKAVTASHGSRSFNVDITSDDASKQVAFAAIDYLKNSYQIMGRMAFSNAARGVSALAYDSLHISVDTPSTPLRPNGLANSTVVIAVLAITALFAFRQLRRRRRRELVVRAFSPFLKRNFGAKRHFGIAK